ncbi:uncharacterized protein si:dkey-19b23.7 [Leucoraja erinacea]|uniref:uncharacterized protein si:dkey-19b23.7 n=1 Tax=Leucoraja erinaceus TaxID=7782 RepID=UPI0024563183|nr:uncharacterized protein si:dkey-19b23.7 [Leucoraja erinacea]
MSSTTEDTANTMKNLEEFLGDLTILGSLQGFRYFQPWLRGREELLLSVANEDIGWQPAGVHRSPAISPGDWETLPAFRYSHLDTCCLPPRCHCHGGESKVYLLQAKHGHC